MCMNVYVLCECMYVGACVYVGMSGNVCEHACVCVVRKGGTDITLVQIGLTK